MKISDSIRQNLVNSTYIHSNTDNFVDISTSHFLFNRSEKAQKEIDEAREKIGNYIMQIITECNQFYSKLGLMSKDFFDLKNGTLELNGAKEFNQKFLKKNIDQLNTEDSFSTVFLSIFDSRNFKERFYEKIKNYKQVPIDADKFLKEYEQITEKSALKTIENIQKNLTIINEEVINNAISKLFTKKQLAIRNGKQITGLRLYSGVQNSLVSILGQDWKNLIDQATNQKNVEKLKDALIKRYIQPLKLSPKEITNILWDTLQEYDFLKKINVEDKDNLKKSFFSHFNSALERYQSNDININILENKSQYSGFILEEGFTFALTYEPELQNLIREIQVVGQDFVERKYKNSLNNNVTIKKGESGTDIEIIISDENYKQQIYKIQAKNSFSDSMFLPIYLQSEIKVDTYAFSVLDDATAKELEYLVFNKAYLSNYGVNQKGQDNFYQGTNNLDQFISFFLYQTLAYLVSGKIKQESDSTINSYEGNLFFIFKGKYLIPVSAFLYSAYSLIIQLDKDSAEIDKMNTIGTLVYNKNLIGVKFSKNKTKDWREKKLKTVKDYWSVQNQADSDRDLSSFYKYPDPMVYIGSDIGLLYKKQASFGKLTFRTAIEQLDRFLK